MFLSSINVKNYRSLEQVRLHGLSRFNVLIGRNNAGKSSVFGALAHLGATLRNEPRDPSTMLTAMEWHRSLAIDLTFKPLQPEREELVSLLSDAGHGEGRREVLLDGAFAREIAFSFATSPHRPDLLHLRQTRLRGEDGRWSVIQRLEAEEQSSNPVMRFVILGPVASRYSENPLDSGLLDVERGVTHGDVPTDQYRLDPSFPQTDFHSDPATIWPYRQLAQYLDRAFFFNPFRHSAEEALPVQPTPLLERNGSNLAQVLHNFHNNQPPTFEAIERFVHAALPDVGRLHTPLVHPQHTEVSFLSPDGGYSVRLRDMGGGIEQLLMVATVLRTTDDRSTLFLEEPESHLHAGTQRFLVEQLYEGDRQIFLTTHSPTFVNLSLPRSLYQVIMANGRSTISRIDEADSLGPLLEDIGARNSDLLLSDAVLFVEGSGDRETLDVWSETLGMGFTGHNVTVLTTGGGEYAERQAPIRIEVLEGISEMARRIPHLFVLDRDQRGPEEIGALNEKLCGRVHVLRRRELENYLLVPRALLEALRAKHRHDQPVLDALASADEEEVSGLIRTSADGLYDLVLLKRIRASLAGLPGGFLPRDAIPALLPYAGSADLAAMLREDIEGRIGKHLDALEIAEVVRRANERLACEWADTERRPEIAPGEEIVAAVFRRYGSNYNKRSDTALIAGQMRVDEVDLEIEGLIRRIVGLLDQP